jgi:hypothetical protein
LISHITISQVTVKRELLMIPSDEDKSAVQATEGQPTVGLAWHHYNRL